MAARSFNIVGLVFGVHRAFKQQSLWSIGGGLCPGLNSVIREIVLMLKQYGVPRVYGCRGGYKAQSALQ
eukprot:3449142-Amphidinium_carterae.1